MSSRNVAEAALHFNSGLESGSSHSPPFFFPSHRFLIRHLCMLFRIALALSLYPEFRPWRPRHPLRANVDGLILLVFVALRRPMLILLIHLIHIIRFHLTCLKELLRLYRL